MSGASHPLPGLCRLSSCPSLTFSANTSIDSVQLDPRGLLFISNMHNMVPTNWKITQEFPNAVVMQVGAGERPTKNRGLIDSYQVLVPFFLSVEIWALWHWGKCKLPYKVLLKCNADFLWAKFTWGVKGNTLLGCMSPTKIYAEKNIYICWPPQWCCVHSSLILGGGDPVCQCDCPTCLSAMHEILSYLLSLILWEYLLICVWWPPLLLES